MGKCILAGHPGESNNQLKPIMSIQLVNATGGDRWELPKNLSQYQQIVVLFDVTLSGTSNSSEGFLFGDSDNNWLVCDRFHSSLPIAKWVIHHITSVNGTIYDAMTQEVVSSYVTHVGQDTNVIRLDGQYILNGTIEIYAK